jgi:membrane protease YdiL (CAAX protease family)
MLFWLDRYPESGEGRWALALVSCAIQASLANGDLASIGLAPPAGGWLRWLRISGILAAIALGIAVVAFASWHLRGRPTPVNLMPMQNIGPLFVPMCLLAPLLEESIYRVVLCAGVAAALGGRWAILVSGISFSLLHLIYGNPSLENQIGGFVLAWAFVSSGSIYVPLLLHAGGNALVLVAHVGGNLWLAPAV